MNKSEQINELATALAKAQGEMNPAALDGHNPFFKSKYSTLKAIFDAVRLPLAKNGLLVTQGIEKLETGQFVSTHVIHSSGQFISSLYPLTVAKQDAQGTASALTYAKRNALMAILGVCSGEGCTEDDDGNAASGKHESYIMGNPGTYVLAIGAEHKGKRLNQLDLALLKKMANFLLDKNEKGACSEIELETLHAIENYLEGRV